METSSKLETTPCSNGGDTGDLSSDPDLPSDENLVRNGGIGHHRPRRNRRVVPEEPEVSLCDLIRNNAVYKTIRCVLVEMFPFLDHGYSINHSVRIFFENLQERPCCTVMYTMLTVFGFIPFIYFTLFISGTFILFFAWFSLCQAMAIMFGAVVFSGFFVFVVVMCCCSAVLFGFVLHILYSWGWTCNTVADIAGEISPRIKKHMTSLGLGRGAHEE